MAKTQRPPETQKRSRRKNVGQCRGPEDLSRLELECMHAIWTQRACTVAEVQRCLSPSRPLAYTTILTILDRLAKKGAVTRSKRGKAHLYVAALSFEDSCDAALDQLVDFYFDGSVEQLVDYMERRIRVAARRSPFQSETPSQDPPGSPSLNESLL